MPVRTCLLCSKKRPRAELVRLALAPGTSSVVIDPGGSMTGRGGYACRECLPNLRLNKRVQRAFRNKAGALDLEEELS
ncbi:MAG: YlxR family protein [Desulfobacteraceae bacterium]|nr:YlxR family protein [Desulfobacteraceae bacterium]